MVYRLRYDQRFIRLLGALPGDIRSLAREQIRQLANVPHPSRARELADHPGYYRLWLPRSHRLVWSVSEEEKVVDLLYIGPKSKDLYNRLGLGKQKSK